MQQKKRGGGFRTLHHNIEKLPSFGGVCGNEQIIINEPEQQLSIDDSTVRQLNRCTYAHWILSEVQTRSLEVCVEDGAEQRR
jgi:hypothetical protein